MSNQLQRMAKGDKAPSVRRNEFNNAVHQLEQKIYHLHNALLENIYVARYASSNVTNFIKFLMEKGIVVETEYRQFVEEQNKKTRLAEEIRQDTTIDRTEKIARAKANNIPDEWVVEPEEAAKALKSVSAE
ncbi:MAG: hypothetical protein HZA78_05925 [Candidatus Schekmanbacteria bacterium]|nr:hypothetical protein [Candidatus Schekmanbacteria bacterium]